MSRTKKRGKGKKTGAKHIATIKQRIEAQRRRAARPQLPVNTQARISESLIERKRKLDRKRAQRRDWDS
jgi:hypothetical protein